MMQFTGTGLIASIRRLWGRRANDKARLCLAPQAEGMALAMLERDGQAVRVGRCEWLPAAEAASSLRIDGICVLVLPFADYRLLTLEEPQVPAEEIRQAIRWIVASRLPDVPIEAMSYDLIRIDPTRTGGARELLVAVAHIETLQRHLLTAEQIGVQLTAIDIPEQAQRNLTHFLLDDSQHQALLALTPYGGLLTVTQGGDLCFHRRFDLDWRRLCSADGSIAQTQLDRLGLELQRSVDYLERYRPDWRLSVLHVVPTLDPAIIGALAQRLNLPIETLALDRLGHPRHPEPDLLAHCWFALGGALRELMAER